MLVFKTKSLILATSIIIIRVYCALNLINSTSPIQQYFQAFSFKSNNAICATFNGSTYLIYHYNLVTNLSTLINSVTSSSIFLATSQSNDNSVDCYYLYKDSDKIIQRIASPSSRCSNFSLDTSTLGVVTTFDTGLDQTQLFFTTSLANTINIHYLVNQVLTTCNYSYPNSTVSNQIFISSGYLHLLINGAYGKTLEIFQYTNSTGLTYNISISQNSQLLTIDIFGADILKCYNTSFEFGKTLNSNSSFTSNLGANLSIYIQQCLMLNDSFMILLNNKSILQYRKSDLTQIDVQNLTQLQYPSYLNRFGGNGLIAFGQNTTVYIGNVNTNLVCSLYRTCPDGYSCSQGGACQASQMIPPNTTNTINTFGSFPNSENNFDGDFPILPTYFHITYQDSLQCSHQFVQSFIPQQIY